MIAVLAHTAIHSLQMVIVRRLSVTKNFISNLYYNTSEKAHVNAAMSFATYAVQNIYSLTIEVLSTIVQLSQ